MTKSIDSMPERSLRLLYVNATHRCNQRCVFCVSTETVQGAFAKTPFTSQGDLSIGRLQRFLADLPDGVSVAHVSGGEPTLHPLLPNLLSMLFCRFDEVQLATNGRRLGDKRYLASLLALGSVHYFIPFFSPSAAVHRRLAGADSLREILGAFRGLSEARERGSPFRLTAKLILMRSTLGSLSSMPRFLRSAFRGVDAFILSGLCRTDSAIAAGEVASFPESREAINATIRALIAEGLPFCLHRIPLCAIEEQLWPAVLTLSDSDRPYERAEAITIYPDGHVDIVLPRKLVAHACRACDLAAHCEVASSRNADKFDYAAELRAVDLATTQYAQTNR
jgi:MoaA/NifB/PqqE/SkfB family radical SAM enzyme